MGYVNKILPVKDTEQIKAKIINRFNKYVRGKIPDVSLLNKGHDGKEGHWLETQMGIDHNASNSPDIDGFEMKNSTKNKTSFGDWSADYYIFEDTNFFPKDKRSINRDKFITIFGASNPKRDGRYSWSGKPVPKVDHFNEFGQKLVIDAGNNILAIYSFSADQRKDKKKNVPSHMQKENLILARWDVKSISDKVDSKFNKLGWFKCEKDRATKAYTSIVFGKPIPFKNWINDVKRGTIYFDSGMAVGRSRHYSQWRAGNSYWKSLITDTH